MTECLTSIDNQEQRSDDVQQATDNLSRKPSGPDKDLTNDDKIKELRAKIDQTEAQMAGTLDAIQGKLTFDHMIHQAGEKLCEAAVGRTKSMIIDAARETIIDTIKNNPLPLTLMGLGASWLVIEGLNRSSDGRRTRSNQHREQEDIEEEFYQAGIEYPVAEQYRRGASSDTRNNTRQDRGTVRQKAEETQQKAKDIAHQARTKGKVLSAEARQQMSESDFSFGQVLQRNLLTIGIAALAVGAVVGLGIPKKREEREAARRERDKILQKSRDVGEASNQ